MTLLIERWRLPAYWQLITVTGFLGGYTTFSSFEFDLLLAARGGNHWLALAYLTGSVAGGFVAVLCGVALVSTTK